MCVNYVALNEPSRRTSHVLKGAPTTDHNMPGSGKVWFAFLGDWGYDSLPTRCVPENLCGAKVPGWMNGSSPVKEEGVVKRTICFHNNGNCCRYRKDIYVRRCHGFNVYKFSNVDASWNARFCTESEEGEMILILFVVLFCIVFALLFYASLGFLFSRCLFVVSKRTFITVLTHLLRITLFLKNENRSAFEYRDREYLFKLFINEVRDSS